MYLASYILIHWKSWMIFSFVICSYEREGGGVIKMLMPIVAATYIINTAMGNNMNIFIYCYQCIKLKNIFLYLQYTSPAGCPDCLEIMLKWLPILQTCAVWTFFRGKRVVNRKIILFRNSYFFCSLFVYLLKRLKEIM